MRTFKPFIINFKVFEKCERAAANRNTQHTSA